MTQAPPATLPNLLRRTLTVFAWTAVPLWPLAIAGIWVMPARCFVVTSCTAMLATTSLLVLHVADVAERNAQLRAAAFEEREQYVILALDRLSDSPTKPQRALKSV